MSQSEHDENSNKEIPLLQRWMDRPFLLLALGMITMLAFYTLWGMWEILTLPKATLP